MPNLKTTEKRKRLQTFLPADVFSEVIQLSIKEERRDSQMGAILIKEALDARNQRNQATA